jgi:hypothetical protein
MLCDAGVPCDAGTVLCDAVTVLGAAVDVLCGAVREEIRTMLCVLAMRDCEMKE